MASTTASKTIILKGCCETREGVANAAITPGMLVEQLSTGKFQKHGTAGGVRPAKYFALEQEWTGKTIDTDYAANDQLRYAVCEAGCQVYALVAASAAAIVIGDLLESAGDGTLRKAGNYLTDSSGGTANTTVQAISGSYTQAEVANNFADLAAALNRIKPGALARAIEAVDNSGGGSAVRIKVEIV